MDCRIYTYTPPPRPKGRAAPTRRRVKLCRVSAFFIRLILIAAVSAIALSMLHKGLSVHFDSKSAVLPTPSAPNAAPPPECGTATPPSVRQDGLKTASPDGAAAEKLPDMPVLEYDFSSPVPLSDEVGSDYFDDAVFIGDSRTEGFFINTGLSNATFYVYKGLTVDTAFTKSVIKKDGQLLSVMDALKSTEFSKVYIMLGINETGWLYNQPFKDKYGDILDSIREINPNALIYIQSILPVSSDVSAEHSYIKNEKINEYNLLLKELAEEKQVYYLEVGSAVADPDGSLPGDAAPDGIHLSKAYCEKWLDYLKTHTIAQ